MSIGKMQLIPLMPHPRSVPSQRPLQPGPGGRRPPGMTPIAAEIVIWLAVFYPVAVPLQEYGETLKCVWLD